MPVRCLIKRSCEYSRVNTREAIVRLMPSRDTHNTERDKLMFATIVSVEAQNDDASNRFRVCSAGPTIINNFWNA